MLNSFRKWWQRAPAAQTQPLRRVQAAARGSAQLPAPIAFGQLRLGAAQSSGLQRTSNEDALFANVEILGTAGSPAQTGLFVVADGVGGHRHGAQASALAVQTVAQAVVPALLAAQAGGGGVQSFDFHASLSAALGAANMAVFAAYPGSGTTVIAALVTGGRLHLAHVGDSRAMLVEAHGMRALTEDHTLVRRLQTAGHITAEQAAVHPQRSTLLRAVGQGEGLQVDSSLHVFEPGGRLLWGGDASRDWSRDLAGQMDRMDAEREGGRKGARFARGETGPRTKHPRTGSRALAAVIQAGRV